MRLIERHTGWPGFGLVPFFADAHRLPAEDAMALTGMRARGTEPGQIDIVVPLLPRISNFDDLDPLRLEPGVALHMVRPGDPLPLADLIILPGSKATIADLGALRRAGWDIDILAHARRGGRVLGICGGYQMLGTRIDDPDGVEGPPGSCPGLGLLQVETVLSGAKTLRAVQGTSVADDAAFTGYEMHVGVTRGPDLIRPLLRFADGAVDGATSPSGQVAGCYVHGFFNHDAQRAAWLHRLGAPVSGIDYEASVEATLDSLAEHLERHVAIDRLLELAR